MDLRQNFLTGTIPSYLQNLSRLSYVNFGRNPLLTGSMPCSKERILAEFINVDCQVQSCDCCGPCEPKSQYPMILPYCSVIDKDLSDGTVEPSELPCPIEEPFNGDTCSREEDQYCRYRFYNVTCRGHILTSHSLGCSCRQGAWECNEIFVASCRDPGTDFPSSSPSTQGEFGNTPSGRVPE